MDGAGRAIRYSQHAKLTRSIVITNIDDPKFDLEKLINAYTTSS